MVTVMKATYKDVAPHLTYLLSLTFTISHSLCRKGRLFAPLLLLQ